MTIAPSTTGPLLRETDRCQHSSVPAYEAPPPCWISTAGDRQRLNLAVETLRNYAITVVPAYDGDASDARSRISRALHTRHPHGTGCYLFWTAAGDRAAFSADGTLTSSLTLHHSPHALSAIRAALTMAGIAHRPGAEPDTITLTPAQG